MNWAIPMSPIYSPDQTDEMYEEIEAVMGSDVAPVGLEGGLSPRDMIQKGLLQTRPYEVKRWRGPTAFIGNALAISRALWAYGAIWWQPLSSAEVNRKPSRKITRGGRPVIGVVGEIYVPIQRLFQRKTPSVPLSSFGGEAWLPSHS